MKDLPNIKNNDGTYKSDAFQKIWNTFFNYVASKGKSVAAGDCLLHCMHSGKNKSEKMTPQAFLTCFQKALWAVRRLDCCYEKKLDNKEAKVLFFYFFPKKHTSW